MKVKAEIVSPLPSMEIALVHSKKKAKKLIEKYGGKVDHVFDSALATTTWIEIDNQNLFLVWIDKRIKATEDQELSILAHEAEHIKQHYFESLNEDNPGIEVEAYVMQWVTHSLFDAHRKWKQKHSK